VPLVRAVATCPDTAGLLMPAKTSGATLFGITNAFAAIAIAAFPR
jgi:hypothetical protein